MTKAILLSLLLSLIACGPSIREEGGDDGTGTGDTTGSGSGSGESRQCEKMDIVFVVDNSGSMEEEQANLGTNFPMFASLLKSYVTNGQALDFRIGLTTTGRTADYFIQSPIGPLPAHDDGDDGRFLKTCNNTSRWLETSDPSMETTLACRAKVGITGPGMEMPLLMAKWSLAERAADTNAGFMRSDALLAIVLLTDEDDQSNTMDGFTVSPTGQMPINFNPQDLVNFLDVTKGNRTRWAAAAIAGDGNCSSQFGNAADGVRLKQFVDLANGGGATQAVFSSICDGDLTAGLKNALDLFQAACGSIIL